MTFYQDITLTKKLTQLSLDINKFCLENIPEDILNPISLEIVLRAPIYIKPGIFILAISLLRFKDAKRLISKYPMLPDNVLFRQSKTKNFVALDFSFLPEMIRQKISFISKNMEVFNYGSISTYILNFIRFNLSHLTLGFNHKAHFFRHLQATYLLTRGYDKVFISKKLGHLDKQSIISYIHNNMF